MGPLITWESTLRAKNGIIALREFVSFISIQKYGKKIAWITYSGVVARIGDSMFENKSVCVVVPAHNESTQIGMVIDTMPYYVDILSSSTKEEKTLNSKLNSSRMTTRFSMKNSQESMNLLIR